MEKNDEYIINLARWAMSPDISFIQNESLDSEREDEIIKLIQYHGMTFILSNFFPETRKKKMALKIKQINYETRCRRMYELSKQVFKDLHENGVKYSIVKGIYLSDIAYGNRHLRMSSDIDIIIAPEEKDIVRDIFEKNGYKQARIKDGRLEEYSREEKLFYTMNTHQLAPFIKDTGEAALPYIFIDVNFDLIWGEGKETKINVDEFLTNSIDYEYSGCSLKVLPFEKNLIQYCLHIYKDMNSVYLLLENQGFKLSCFCDVYGCLKNRKNIFDKTLFINLIRKYNLEKYIYTIFYYTSLIFEDNSILNIFDDIPFDNMEFLDEFGFEEEERKKWPVNFFDRIFSTNRLEILQPILSENELKKLELNRKNL